MPSLRAVTPFCGAKPPGVLLALITRSPPRPARRDPVCSRRKSLQPSIIWCRSLPAVAGLSFSSYASRCSRWSLLPGSQEVPASVPALSGIAGDTAGVSVCCLVFLLLSILCRCLRSGLILIGADHRRQALLEDAQRYRLLQQAACHVRDGLVSGRFHMGTAGPGVGGCTAEPMDVIY